MRVTSTTRRGTLTLTDVYAIQIVALREEPPSVVRRYKRLFLRTLMVGAE